MLVSANTHTLRRMPVLLNASDSLLSSLSPCTHTHTHAQPTRTQTHPIQCTAPTPHAQSVSCRYILQFLHHCQESLHCLAVSSMLITWLSCDHVHMTPPPPLVVGHCFHRCCLPETACLLCFADSKCDVWACLHTKYAWRSVVIDILALWGDYFILCMWIYTLKFMIDSYNEKNIFSICIDFACSYILFLQGIMIYYCASIYTQLQHAMYQSINIIYLWWTCYQVKIIAFFTHYMYKGCVLHSVVHGCMPFANAIIYEIIYIIIIY